ncbi:hypothetical protein LY76DRAFT_117476 [Colletotrichum caudatum]|nr:hypothetical protein LY76DRAFT_117476 [Colletotrichum caudatum]
MCVNRPCRGGGLRFDPRREEAGCSRVSSWVLMMLDGYCCCLRSRRWGVSRDGGGGGMRVRRERERRTRRRWRTDGLLPFWRGREDVKLRCAGGCWCFLFGNLATGGALFVGLPCLSVVICTVLLGPKEISEACSLGSIPSVSPPSGSKPVLKMKNKKREREKAVELS